MPTFYARPIAKQMLANAEGDLNVTFGWWANHFSFVIRPQPHPWQVSLVCCSQLAIALVNGTQPVYPRTVRLTFTVARFSRAAVHNVNPPKAVKEKYE
jgi:hypothetical protein